MGVLGIPSHYWPWGRATWARLSVPGLVILPVVDADRAPMPTCKMAEKVGIFLIYLLSATGSRRPVLTTLATFDENHGQILLAQC